MRAKSPKRVLIAGGGIAAMEALMALRRLAGDRVEIDLLAPDEHFVYVPLSVAEPFGEDPVLVPLERIAEDFGAALHAGSLVAVETDRNVVRTRGAGELAYDALVVACGARRTAAVDGAITFAGAAGRERVGRLMRELEAGRVGEVVFVVPEDSGWPLPLYELALMTASRLTAQGQGWHRLTVVTPEERPLAVLGESASAAVGELLDARRIRVVTGAPVDRFDGRRLWIRASGHLATDEVVALPRVEGAAIAGLPVDERGFIEVSDHGRVIGLETVFAAGDATTLAVKQGGLAAQQADAIASVIARRAGARVRPPDGDPVLRAVLLNGGQPRFIRATIADGGVVGSVVSREPLWRPPSKVASRFLSPYLAGLNGIGAIEPAHMQDGAVMVFEPREGAGGESVARSWPKWPSASSTRR